MSWDTAPVDNEAAQWQDHQGSDGFSHDVNDVDNNNNDGGSFTAFDSSNTSKHDGPSTGACFNCGQEGHIKAECTNPAVERAFDGICHNCSEHGHRSTSCLQPSKGRTIALYGPHVKDADPAEAWSRLLKSSADKDLDEFRKAIEQYCKATPDATYVDLETGLRAAGGKIYLIAVEQAVADTHTIVNLQGQIDQKYVVSYQYGQRPNRPKFASGWPSTPDENLERLKVAGWIKDRGLPKCRNCDELGHISKHCPNERVEREKTDAIVCNNCKENGHRLRDCPQPRIDPNVCRNCKQSGHRASDCDKPRDMSDVECKYCKELGHFVGDCPTKPKMTCRNCGEEGHKASECEQEQKLICRNCDEEGHVSRDCPKPRDYSRVQCTYCQEMGHTPVRCQKKKADDAAGETKDGGEDVVESTGGW